MQAKNLWGFTKNAVPIVTRSKWYKHEAGANTRVRRVGCSVRELFQKSYNDKSSFMRLLDHFTFNIPKHEHMR